MKLDMVPLEWITPFVLCVRAHHMSPNCRSYPVSQAPCLIHKHHCYLCQTVIRNKTTGLLCQTKESKCASQWFEASVCSVSRVHERYHLHNSSLCALAIIGNTGVSLYLPLNTRKEFKLTAIVRSYRCWKND